MTVRRKTLVSLWATCDGTCGQWLAPEDEDVVLTQDGELADLLDMHDWLTVVRWGQRFHYCHQCAEMLCNTCERFVGRGRDERCVFCTIREGRRVRRTVGAALFVPEATVLVTGEGETLTGVAASVELAVRPEPPMPVGIGEQEPIRAGLVDSHAWGWKAGAGWGAAFGAAIVVWLLALAPLLGWWPW